MRRAGDSQPLDRTEDVEPRDADELRVMIRSRTPARFRFGNLNLVEGSSLGLTYEFRTGIFASSRKWARGVAPSPGVHHSECCQFGAQQRYCRLSNLEPPLIVAVQQPSAGGGLFVIQAAKCQTNGINYIILPYGATYANSSSKA